MTRTKAIDPIGVCTVCLAEALRPLIERRYREMNGQRGAWIQFSVLEPLSRDAGVHSRSVYEILSHRKASTGLAIADALLCAFDRPDLVYHLDELKRHPGVSLGKAGTHVCPGRRGEHVDPPLTPVVERQVGDKVSVTCPGCGSSRLVTRGYARKKLRPDTVCRACNNRVTAETWRDHKIAPALPMGDGGTSGRGAPIQEAA